METRKTPRANLENKRLLFGEIGLVAALLLLFGAMESRSREINVSTLEGNTTLDIIEDIIPITQEVPPEPSAPKIPVLSDVIEVVEDDIKVDDNLFQNLEDASDMGVEIMDYVEDVQEETVAEEEIPFVLVEVKPTFQGGDANAFSRWVNQHLSYPDIAKENGVQGRVLLQFTVGTDGSVSAVKVLRGIDSSLDQEAVRVVSASPKWTPGRQRDRAVKVTYTFPVFFQLR